MLHTSMTALEFQDAYRTEDDCLDALFKLRWPNGFICPNCGHDCGYKLSCGLYQCAVCRHQASVTSGTIFHGTKIPLRKWFWIIFEVAQDEGGASSSRLTVQLGMYQKTVWYILQKIRHAMGSHDQHVSLAGLIELDEAIIGKQARKTGRLKKTKEGGTAPYKQGKLSLGSRKGRTGKPKTQTPVLVLVRLEISQQETYIFKLLKNQPTRRLPRLCQNTSTRATIILKPTEPSQTTRFAIWVII